MLIELLESVLASELAIMQILPDLSLCASFFGLFDGSSKHETATVSKRPDLKALKKFPINSYFSPSNHQRLLKPVQLSINKEGYNSFKTLALAQGCWQKRKALRLSSWHTHEKLSSWELASNRLIAK